MAGLYLHIPFCDAKCPYCAFYSVTAFDSGTIDAYIDALEQESSRRLRKLARKPQINSIYIGGGTPSILSARQLERLCAMILETFQPAAGTEWTLECNPGSINAEKLAALTAAGVNRISLGAQSLNDNILKTLGRRHSADAVRRATADISHAGITNLNLDLIACVPGLGETRLRKILEQAVELRPAHLSVYALTLAEGRRLPAPASTRSNRPAIFDDAKQLRHLRLVDRFLREQGYKRYEISNYARRGRRCGHHIDCWDGKDYIGLGPGAVTRLGAVRRRNEPDLKAYLRKTRDREDAPHEEERLTPAIRAAEKLVFGLRCIEGVDIPGICREFDLPSGVQQWPMPALRRLRSHGLVRQRHGRTVLSTRGMELADAVALELWP